MQQEENNLERLVNKQLTKIQKRVSDTGGRTNIHDLKFITEYMYKKEFPTSKLDLNYYHYLCGLKLDRVIDEINFLGLTRQ